MKPVLLVLGTALFYDQGGEAVSRFGFAWQQHLQSRLASSLRPRYPDPPWPAPAVVR